MTKIDLFAELPKDNGPSPDYPYCPLTTGHTNYLMDVEDGHHITLTCTTCHLKVEEDLLDAFATSCEIPVTVEFSSHPGDGWEFGPEFSGTITPRDGAQQLRAERDTWKGRALGLQTERDELAAKLTAALQAISQIAPPPDFFRPGVTYIERRPFAAPETLSVFRCLTIAEHPRAGAGLRALGFHAHAHPGNDWASAAMTISDWTRGWSIYTPLLTTEQTADQDDELTLRDVDPEAVYATEDNDYWEEAHEGLGQP